MDGGWGSNRFVCACAGLGHLLFLVKLQRDLALSPVSSAHLHFLEAGSTKGSIGGEIAFLNLLATRDEFDLEPKNASQLAVLFQSVES